MSREDLIATAQDLDKLAGIKDERPWRVLTQHIEDVRACHKKFGILTADKPGNLTQRKLKERVEFLLEELTELATAGNLGLEQDQHTGAHYVSDMYLGVKPNLPEIADALIDLVYIACGTAVMLGLPWQELWDDVQRANLGKVRGIGKRGHQVDLIKPPGWEGPKTAELLKEAGWDPADTTERDDQ